MVGQVLKENATEVRPKDPQLVWVFFFFFKNKFPATTLRFKHWYLHISVTAG